MKNFLFLILCLVLVTAGAFGFSEYFYGSSGIMESGIVDVVRVDSFERMGKVVVLEDPEDETEEKIIEILSKAERKNRSYKPKAIEGSRMDYEIELYFMDIYKHRFLYLGKESGIYDPDAGKSWEIINADEIISELEAFLAE